MNQYVTGAVIRRLREEKGLTQADLAASLMVSGKAVSRWETGRGYPDITLIEPLAAALGISVAELLSGSPVVNGNRSFNMLRTRFYVCPICGNVLWSTGEAAISCCGLTLTPLEAEACDDAHEIRLEPVEDEYWVTVDHEMSKTHYLTFLAALTDCGVQVVKLYPEGEAGARFKRARVRAIYACCNRHGMFMVRPGRK